MAFGSSPTDVNNIPIGASYVPGTGFISLQGGATFTDASSNVSAPMRVEMTAGSKVTYGAVIVGGALAATPTHIVTLTGSSTKTVRLVRALLTIMTSAVGVSLLDAKLTKMSTALTGGVPVTMTAIPFDANSSGASATAQNWTTTATGGGALVGDLAVQKVMPMFSGAQTATDFPSQPLPQVIWDYSAVNSQQPTLRGVAQVLSINLNGGTLVATTTYSAFLVWTEE